MIYITKTCPYCGKQFQTTNPSQVYCSNECRIKLNNERKVQKNRERRALEKERKLAALKRGEVYCVSSKCNRINCIHFSGMYSNRCNCLIDLTDEYIKKCSFYKKRF